jgi:hypothetical protein
MVPEAAASTVARISTWLSSLGSSTSPGRGQVTIPPASLHSGASAKSKLVAGDSTLTRVIPGEAEGPSLRTRSA